MINAHDREILRALADERSQIAALPVQAERAALWTRLNDLDSARPMIWINEIPWHEMNVNDELTLCCEGQLARAHEQRVRRELYQWRHMPGDMIVEPAWYSPLVINDTGFGIDEDVDIAETDAASDVVSRHFHIQIQDEADLAKIKTPVITHDAEASERNYEALVSAIGDITPVQKLGVPGQWFAPWDELIRWWGVQEAMMDLVLRPELVHAAMDRLVNGYLARLDQWVDLNLLSRNDNNTRNGSGGYGYSSQLPADDFSAERVRPKDLFGSAAAQIFSDVSPDMHVEFALQYERRWLDQFGLTYYGCCEPLHLKVDMLRQIPNLRKISMSPWVDLEIAADKIGGDYVFSRKPNPAVFCEDGFDPQRARDELTQVLDIAQGCHVEFIMKDISTVRYQPQRLWQWAEIARDVVEAGA